MANVKKERIDVLLVERGLVESRSLAQRLVMAGQVRVNGQLIPKPSIQVEKDADLEIEPGPQYVSRGGEKLAGAFDMFSLDVAGQVCVDVGASTGGFTDCLLQHGAAKVYAIDVGKGILHWKIRQDPRVVVMEETNARHVEQLPEPISFVTIDASFISLKILLPVIKNWFGAGGGRAIALVKPQFEAGREQASKGKGVIKDPKIHRTVLKKVLGFAEAQGLSVLGLERSPIKGPKGNIEFLAYFGFPGKKSSSLSRLISRVV
jgi:23S rRNA (cytidine1920-2'-O)/16S rRNA (cytidine1409-2'-O)-methyltransferase